MSFSELISPLVGRLVLAWFFLTSSFTYGAQWHATITLMSLKDMPSPALLLFGAILLMIVGGVSLVFGFYARAGALMLFAFTVCASVLMHDYWKISDAAARAADYDIFARNMAIAGGLLLIVGMGAGPFSIDNRMGGGRD
ncbi:MAG TPA: DoxX family protein [Rhizomicrobium sp.]